MVSAATTNLCQQITLGMFTETLSTKLMVDYI